MRRSATLIGGLLTVIVGLIFPSILQAQGMSCSQLPDHAKLKQALTEAAKGGQKARGGMGNQEWGVIVDRDGIVCAVAFSGPTPSSQWPGSRLIAAIKASTANAFSLQDYALSTGNLYASVQPGGELYGTLDLTPNPAAAFAGPPVNFGETNDPMIGKAIGGVITYAGGLALYTPEGQIVGGLGASGDTPCSDHVVAWKMRHKLHLDSVPMGPGPQQSDNLIFDIHNGVSESGFGHPTCKGGLPSKDIIENLTKTDPLGPRRMPKLGAMNISH